MPTNHPVSVEYLSQALRYEPDTGKLFWLARPLGHFETADIGEWWNGRFAGEEAGSERGPYGCARISIDKHSYQGRRVAWALHHGAWPAGKLSNLNGDPADNRIANLQADSYGSRLGRKPRRSNKSGVTGVFWLSVRGKWCAMIEVGYSPRNLGYFDTREEAIVARQAAERTCSEPDGSEFV